MHSREEAARRAMTIALRIAIPLSRNRDDASDVAQDVALDVLRSLDQLRDPAAFDAWVRRIAVRHAVRAARTRSRQRAAIARAHIAADELVRAEPVDHDALIASRRALAEALANLPARQAAALILKYVDDLTDREIAEALGCRRGTANALLSRGRAALRQVASLKELASMMEITR
jgi:RNA polymerase sigma factor (sigma-70 family)